MRWLVVCVALTLSAEARGEALVGRAVEQPTPTIGIGRPDHGAKVDRAALDLWLRPDRAVVRMTLDVRGADATFRDVELALDLPFDARATGLTITMDEVRFRASPMAIAEAREFYKETVERFTDPVLLERTSGTRYRLRLFPVTRAMPASVEIVFSIPRERALAIAPIGHAIANLAVKIDGDGEVPRSHRWTGVAKSHAFTLPAPRPGIAEAVAIDGPAVDGTMSLVAGGTAAQLLGSGRVRRGGDPVPTVTIGVPVSSCGHSRPLPIRRFIKLQHPRLRHCYMKSAQRDPSLHGIVELQFMVHVDGSVTPSSVFGGELQDAQVQACLRDEIAAWNFGPTDRATQVNYPLTFRLSE